jgi:hypothetical protein
MAQFNAITEAIVSTFETTTSKEASLRLKNVGIQNKAIQTLVDAHIVANDKPTKALYMKGNASTNDARKEVKALFDKLASEKFISKTSGGIYQTCFWIAFETGVPFSRDLHNAKSEAKAETAKAETAKAETESTKAGKVETTTIAEMHKTLSKALAQARILNQTIFAGELVDFIIATYPDFKETVLGK